MGAEDTRSLRDARADYFRDNRIAPDGGYSDRWVKLSVGPLPFAFPNTSARRRAVPFHDLNHVVTGYPTTLLGEAEIGAWEIASGCLHVPIGLYLDLLVMGFVLMRHPRAIYRAFLRGRHSRNLYGCMDDPELLGRSVAEQRRALGLDAPLAPPTPADQLAFALWAGVAVAIVWGPIPLIALILLSSGLLEVAR